MLMVSQQGVSRNADGRRNSSRVSHNADGVITTGVSHNADGVAAATG